MKTIQNKRDRECLFFRMPYKGRREFERNPFSPMAYVDMGLLIVLFFITAHYSELVLRPGINLELPPSKYGAGVHYSKFDTILITLSREGMVFFNDELTTLEGLEASISKASHDNPDVSMLIQADGRIEYGTILKIFNIGAESGIESITMATSLAQETVSIE